MWSAEYFTVDDDECVRGEGEQVEATSLTGIFREVMKVRDGIRLIEIRRIG